MPKEKLKKTKRNTKQDVKMLVRFLNGSKRFFIVSIISSLLISLLEMVTPQIIANTVDSVIGSEPLDLPEWIVNIINKIGGVEYLRANLWIIGLSVVAIGAIAAVLKYVNTYYNAKGAETLDKTMRDSLFEKITHLPMAWHSKNKTGDIIQRCTSDVETIKVFVADQLYSLFRIVILIVVSLVVMISMRWQLALVAIIAMPIILTYTLIFRSKVEKHFTEVDEAEGILGAVTQENLTGVRVVRAFGREDYERRKFAEKNDRFANLNMRLCKFFAYFWGIGDFISGIQVVLVIALGAAMCVNSDFTAGDYIAFVSYNAMLIWPVRQLGRVISDMSKANVAIGRINYIMCSESEDNGGQVAADMHGDIEFDSVTFAYNNHSDGRETQGEKILDNVSFNIKGGSVLGIMGGTGSGKSTVVALLERLYDTTEGEIRIGGIPIREIPRDLLHNSIGCVLQEPYLFARSIGENIAITKPEATDEEISVAADAACFDSSVREFAEGYKTLVGERGVTLSGGQKQRCAIARMLMQNAPIMIMDDSLSAVDTETDVKIRAALKERFSGSTVILISHRISTLMQADKIIVLENGKVAESGTHRELVEAGGIYSRVCTIQKGIVEEGGESNG